MGSNNFPQTKTGVVLIEGVNNSGVIKLSWTVPKWHTAHVKQKAEAHVPKASYIHLCVRERERALEGKGTDKRETHRRVQKTKWVTPVSSTATEEMAGSSLLKQETSAWHFKVDCSNKARNPQRQWPIFYFCIGSFWCRTPEACRGVMSLKGGRTRSRGLSKEKLYSPSLSLKGRWWNINIKMVMHFPWPNHHCHNSQMGILG